MSTNDKWSALSMKDKADLIKLMVKNGVTSLDDMKLYYNGGEKEADEPKNLSIIERVVKRYLFGNKTDYEVRKALYDNLYPYGYGGVDMFESLARTKSAASGERDPKWKIYDGDGTLDQLGVDDGRYYGGRDDIFATYLGIPEKDRHNNFRDRLAKVSESKYRPTKGMENNKYYRIDITDDDKHWLIRSGLQIPIGESKVSGALEHYFGDHTLSHGLDKNGEYISYYDNWDINPLYGRHRVNKEKNIHLGYLPTILKSDSRYDGETFLEGLLNGDIKYYRSNTPAMFNLPNPFVSQKGDTGDMSLGIGKPIHFYDRIYLDDYYGVKTKLNPDEYYGGYIQPALITAEQKANGGKIHIKPENRGKFTALKERTGHSTSWFREHGTPAQKKMATFALNARKWHHGDGGPLGDRDTLSHPRYNAQQESVIWNYLTSRGLNDAQAAGLMGNIAVESLLNSNINQFNGPAYGFIQAEGARKKALKAYQGDPYVFGSGLLPEEQKQLDYIINMGINNYTPGEWGKQGYSGARAARKAFLDSSDVNEASDIITRNYLRPSKPHTKRRRDMSEYYFNKYGHKDWDFTDSEWNLKNILKK